MPENGAIHMGFPSHSYKKCNNVPPSYEIVNTEGKAIAETRFARLFFDPERERLKAK